MIGWIMPRETIGKVGILWRDDRRGPLEAMSYAQRLAPVFEALAAEGVAAEAVVFDDEYADEVRAQLLGLDGVLVWVDPVMRDGSRSGERTRVVLDALLRDVAGEGVRVSAHPDVIEKMGTKELLVAVRDLIFGSETYIYRTAAEFYGRFGLHLAREARVLKPYKGNAGIGVWKVDLVDDPSGDATVEVQDAHFRGTEVERMRIDDFFLRWGETFDDGGGLVDQPFQPRIADGMIRCYMVRGEVAGFAHQKPDAAQLASGRVFGLPSKKTMFASSEPRFAALKRTVETSWLGAMLEAVGVTPGELPLLWDADFMYGPKTEAGEDTYVLCEINCSCVIPFPPAVPGMVAAGITAWLRGQD